MKKKLLAICMIFAMICSMITPMAVQAEEKAPIYTVLVLDTSDVHKFYTNANTSREKLIYTANTAKDEVKTAATEFANKLTGFNDNHHVAVVTYQEEATRVCDFSTDKATVVNSIQGIKSSDSDVCIAAGLKEADKLLSAVAEPNAVKNVVVFTTGYSNVGEYWEWGKYSEESPAGNWYNMETKLHLYGYANKVYESAQVLHKYANVYTVGLFELWNGMPDKGKELVTFFKMLTEDIASKKENYYPVNNKNNIGNTFAEIGNKIISNPFKDVTYKGYYFDAVLWANEEKITSGVTPETFDPNASCTREQMVAFLWRSSGSPASDADIPFVDVASSRYSYAAIRWAVENKITAGTSETTFSPAAIVTREQVVTFLWRMDGYKEVTTENVFTDVSENDYSYEAILWAKENGITEGLTPTTFGPKQPCTRGQIITFLYRYYQNAEQ